MEKRVEGLRKSVEKQKKEVLRTNKGLPEDFQAEHFLKEKESDA